MGRPAGSKNKNTKHEEKNKPTSKRGRPAKEKDSPSDDEEKVSRAVHVEKKRGRPKGWKKDPNKKSVAEVKADLFEKNKKYTTQSGITSSGNPEKDIKGNGSPETEIHYGIKYYVYEGYIGRSDKERIIKNAEEIKICLYPNKGKQEDWLEIQWPPVKVKLRVAFIKDKD